jgi:serine/threonine-protein kinase HipA
MHDAPKRMSVAGAQHKLLVILEGDALYEPLPGDASTHILKPDHPEPQYPHTVINEYFSMVLAHEVGLDVPRVVRRYVPEPVYIVERFDRVRDGDNVRRKHVIDTCQLLGKARTFKYTAATVESLSEIATACRAQAAARLALYRWLVFNILIGNGDNHLKNISALVGPQGIELAPAYDLVATAAYATRAFSDQPSWPGLELALSLPGASRFGEVTKKNVLDAADVMGVPRGIANRELTRLIQRAQEGGPRVLTAIEAENAGMPQPAKAHFAGELRMLRTITSIVLPDMVRQLT